MILAIETATPVCSVALGDEKGAVYELRETGNGIHSEKLFHFIEELMREHQLDAGRFSEVLLSGGPGSYTGLRIGAAAVKGLLFQRDIPLYVLGSLEAVAAGVVAGYPNAGRIHSVIDARRQHLYHQLFTIEDGGVTSSDVSVQLLDEIDESITGGDFIAGTGLERLKTYQLQLKSESVHFLNESCISAANLITARNHPAFRKRFKGVASDLYEPDYISMGQAGGR